MKSHGMINGSPLTTLALLARSLSLPTIAASVELLSGPLTMRHALAVATLLLVLIALLHPRSPRSRPHLLLRLLYRHQVLLPSHQRLRQRQRRRLLRPNPLLRLCRMPRLQIHGLLRHRHHHLRLLLCPLVGPPSLLRSHQRSGLLRRQLQNLPGVSIFPQVQQVPGLAPCLHRHCLLLHPHHRLCLCLLSRPLRSHPGLLQSHRRSHLLPPQPLTLPAQHRFRRVQWVLDLMPLLRRLGPLKRRPQPQRLLLRPRCPRPLLQRLQRLGILLHRRDLRPSCRLLPSLQAPL